MLEKSNISVFLLEERWGVIGVLVMDIGRFLTKWLNEEESSFLATFEKHAKAELKKKHFLKHKNGQSVYKKKKDKALAGSKEKRWIHQKKRGMLHKLDHTDPTTI